MSYQELYDAGLEALRAQRAADALAPLTECTQLAPEQADAWLFLGVAHGMLDQTAEAHAALTHAGELAPSDARVHYNLGRLAQRAGDPEAATACYQQCLALDPSNQRAREALAALSPAVIESPMMPDQVIAPPPESPLGLAGWYGVSFVDPTSVFRCLTLVTFLVSVVAVSLSLVGEALGGFKPAGLGMVMAQSLANLLLVPPLTGLGGYLGALCYNRLVGRNAARVRIEAFGGRQRLAEVDPVGAGRAFLYWSVPGLLLVAAIVGIAVVVVGGTKGEPGTALIAGALVMGFGLPLTALMLFLMALLAALFYNVAAMYAGGIQGSVSIRGSRVKLLELDWSPTLVTVYMAALPWLVLGVGGMVLALAGSAVNKQAGTPMAVLVMAIVTMLLAPAIRLAAYRRALRSGVTYLVDLDQD